MSSILFPFPDRETALNEILSDPASSSLTEEEKNEYLHLAWDFGEKAATDIFDKYGYAEIKDIISDYGILILYKYEDNVAGGRRYFSVYETGTDKVELYMKAIEMWADKNELHIDDAVSMILSHEFFHILENKEIGFASKLVTLPILQIGSIRIGKKGIRSLSEVGAHAFARKLFELMNDITL